MYTLFISTFDKLITIGLLKNNKLLNKLEKESTRNHSVYVMPMIDNILKMNEIDTTYINQIIVVNGPGSFTGVRIGVTIAKTLAYTLDIPIKTITSLESIAVSSTKLTNKLVLIEDLKGYFVGYYNKDNELIEEYKYIPNKEYEKYIKGKKRYIIKDIKLDVEKINNYLLTKDSINSHLVNPIYVKGIEALNGK